jgi:hypothetical protein
MSRLRSQSGQAGAEYMGVLLIVALIVAALAASGLASDVAGSATHFVKCTATGGCTAAPGGGGSVGSGGGGGGGSSWPGGNQVQAALPTPGPAQPAGGDVPAQPEPPQPGPAPGPPASAAASWPGPAANLPQSGDRVFKPRKKDRGKPQRVPLGDRGGKKGYIDDDGNKWEWVPEGSGAAHGGAHWDVQHPDGSHTNVFPDGNVVGEDNFPNKSRGGSESDNSGSTSNSTSVDPGTVAGVVGGGIATGGLIWWLGKLASPACGPAVLVCAVVL